jgi:hypothetical protein
MKKKPEKKCKCPLGRYWHSSSELSMFRYQKDIDGLGSIYEWFNYCPYCGKDLRKDKKQLWGYNEEKA